MSVKHFGPVAVSKCVEDGELAVEFKQGPWTLHVAFSTAAEQAGFFDNVDEAAVVWFLSALSEARVAKDSSH